MKSKRTGKLVFFVVFILILALTYTAFFGIDNYYGDTRQIYFKGANDIRWGIDIKGGVEAVFSPDKNDVDITEADMDSAKAIIETRLVNKNITDYEVYADNDNHQIIVRFPWAADESEFDAAAAVQELGETALLTFCRNQDNKEEQDTCIHREFIALKIYTHCPGDNVVTIIASYKKEKGTKSYFSNKSAFSY